MLPLTEEAGDKPGSWWRGLGLVAVFFCLPVILQVLSGAYHAEFGGYPDESAHYVTSLMVRDFLASGDYTQPMQFAQDYYEHYPKVAFGHWPPLFYALGGLWMLLFSPSRASVLVGLAVLTTVLAWLTYSTVKRHFGWKAGALGGLLLICLPVIQTYSDEVMAESLLAIVSLSAASYFARYLVSERWQDSAWFGLFAALAILTKGSGWDLAMVPPLALLLTRQFRLLRQWKFWISALIVVLICAPWQWMTMTMAQRGWDGTDHPTWAYTLQALGQFFWIFGGLFGWGLTLVILLGIAVTVVAPYFEKSVDAEFAALFALIPAAWIFHSIVPAGSESRRLLIAVPGMILFLVAGGTWLARRFRWNRGVVAAAVILIFALEKFTIPAEIHFGYTEAAQFIRKHGEFRNNKILVASERDGEGMLISELAMIDQRPAGHEVIRATKVLARTDWNGNVSAYYCQTPEKLLEYVRGAGIGVVVTDTLPALFSFEYERVLREAIAKYPERLKRMASFQGEARGAVSVYRVER